MVFRPRINNEIEDEYEEVNDFYKYWRTKVYSVITVIIGDVFLYIIYYNYNEEDVDLYIILKCIENITALPQ